MWDTPWRSFQPFFFINSPSPPRNKLVAKPYHNLYFGVKQNLTTNLSLKLSTKALNLQLTKLKTTYL